MRHLFKTPLLSPSLLSAQFSTLATEIQFLEKHHVQSIHLDIMDGHFVPNLSFGPGIVASLRACTQMSFDCHLMVENPEKWILPFVQAGANWITVHAESTPHLNKVLQSILDLGCRAGVALNPATPLQVIEEVLDQVNLVLLMSVNPGWGGQSFLESSVSKLKRLVQLRAERSFMIQMDGGIQLNHVEFLCQQGVDGLVVGSAIFSAQDREKTMQDFQKLF